MRNTLIVSGLIFRLIFNASVHSPPFVMQFYMELLFQLRELLLKIQYCMIKVILIFNLQFIPY